MVSSGKTRLETLICLQFPLSVRCELMHLDDGNPTVDGHINFKPSEEIAGSQEFLVPIIETTECKLPLTELREEKDEG